MYALAYSRGVGGRRLLLAGVQYMGAGGRKSPVGSRSKAPVEGLGDKVSQKLTMFRELALLGWTLVKGLKHLRFIL